MSYNIPVGHIEFRTYDGNKPVRGYGGNLTVEGLPDLEVKINELYHHMHFINNRIDVIENETDTYDTIMAAIANLTEKYNKLITALETMKRGDELYKLLTYTYEGGEN